MLVDSALPAQTLLLMFDSSCLKTEAFELFIVLGRWCVFFCSIYKLEPPCKFLGHSIND